MSIMIKNETNNEANRAFQLKGSLFTLTILQLLTSDIKSLQTQLTHTIAQSPKFFQHAPIVIDLGELQTITDINIEAIAKCLRAHALIPVGVRTSDKLLADKAIQAGLAVFSKGASSAPISEKKSKSKAAEEDTNSDNNASSSITKTRVITQPVRSGQQIYAQGGDLIVLSSVSPGAEVLADGHIHVYGTLKGRALAGILGDTQARIICKQLDAELISIAGRYLVRDNMHVPKEPGYHHIFLENDQLEIAAI